MTKKETFLGEPVQPNAGTSIPISSGSEQAASAESLSRNPALDSAEATGVQRLLNIITPYRIDIQQGNFVSQEMLAKIQPGMTKEQVRFALGTPLLTDVFHAKRWDYLFRLQKPNGRITNNRVIVYFDDNRVARVVNDPLPNEVEYLETISGRPLKKKVDESGEKKAEHREKPSTEEKEAVKPVEAPAEKAKETSSVEQVEREAVTPLPETPSSPESAEVRRAAPESSGTREAAPQEQPAETPTRREAAKQVAAPKATTVQDISGEPEEDFMPSPYSTMQLKELMQPQ
ncbi:MAG: outer membrane protein assembly factor BamE [Burkholderiaceae bacterium]|nr:outer membrane protein assembly factor BamE [Burkholderiaceae bacterium]